MPLVRGLLDKEDLPVRGVEEREDKFHVDHDWALPEVMRLVPDGGRLDQQVRKLDDTYFDTPGGGLSLFGITLRRRVGGSETGWQLRVPNGTARTELQSGSRSGTLPVALAKGVASLLAGESLVPVARLMTTRTAYWVLNSDVSWCWTSPTTGWSLACITAGRCSIPGVKWKSNWGRRARRRT